VQVRVWRAATSIMAGVGDRMQMIGDGRTGRVLDGWMIGMSGDAMCSLHRARTWSTGFLVEPQN
jgi:hypothetical protein